MNKAALIGMVLFGLSSIVLLVLYITFTLLGLWRLD